MLLINLAYYNICNLYNSLLQGFLFLKIPVDHLNYNY